MNKQPASSWWRKRMPPPVKAGEIVPKEGLRVVDGLLLKEYREGAWASLGVASSEDVRLYPTVVD